MTPDVRTSEVNATAAVMLLLRRLRSIRSLPFIVLACACVVLLFVSYSGHLIPLPQAKKPEPPVRKYQSTPTYEHPSPYRQHADLVFEQTLDGKLQHLETQLRGALPASERDLTANRTVWQIADAKEAAAWKVFRKQWRTNNPDWAYEFYSVEQRPTGPLSHFASVPEIAAAYEELPDLRKDLLRYLLLWYQGGFFSEVDTWNRMAMQHCFPIDEVVHRRRNISLMIGVEIDEPYWNAATQAAWHWSRSFGFGQSVIWAPKRFDPIVRRTIVRAIAHMRMRSQTEQTTLASSGKQIDMGEVTGASMFTDVVLEALSENLVADHVMRDRDAGLERRVTWKRFRSLKDTVWIEAFSAAEGKEDDMRGLAILPINVWSSGQRHSGSGSFDQDEACVNHVYGKRPRRLRQGLLERIFG